MADYIDTTGRTIDYLTESIARAYVAPFGMDRALARALISYRVTLQLIAGRDPHLVIASLTALLAKLHEPARLPHPVTPVSPIRP